MDQKRMDEIMSRLTSLGESDAHDFFATNPTIDELRTEVKRLRQRQKDIDKRQRTEVTRADNVRRTINSPTLALTNDPDGERLTILGYRQDGSPVLTYSNFLTPEIERAMRDELLTFPPEDTQEYRELIDVGIIDLQKNSLEFVSPANEDGAPTVTISEKDGIGAHIVCLTEDMRSVQYADEKFERGSSEWQTYFHDAAYLYHSMAEQKRYEEERAVDRIIDETPPAPQYVRAVETQMEWLRYGMSNMGLALAWESAHTIIRQQLVGTPRSFLAAELKQKINRARDEILAPIRYGDAYFLGSNVQRLLDTAADDLPAENAIFLPRLLPSPMGFMVFEHPITFPGDVSFSPSLIGGMNNNQYIDAIGWAMDRPLPGYPYGTDNVWYREYRLHLYSIDAPMRSRHRARFRMKKYGDLIDPASVLPEVIEGSTQGAFVEIGSILVKPGYEMVTNEEKLIKQYGESLKDLMLVNENDVFKRMNLFVKFLRWFAALLYFMNDRVAPQRSYRLPRHIRRQTDREEVQHEHVHVIQLRRRESVQRTISDGDLQHVDWKCQWWVSGHWRNQWYPKMGRNLPKYIEGYVKGPSHLPFKDNDERRIFAVVR